MTLRVGDFAAVSDTGRLRRANEDAYYARAPLFAVADGMGGAQAGDVASKIATEALARGLDDSLAPEPRLSKVVLEANSEIHTRSVSSAELQGMGTTLTAMLLGDEEVTVAHVGDSRAYRLRDGELARITRDHSLVGEMVRRGALSEAEAETHPQRSILTRALGPEAQVEVDVHTHGARDGDVYLLCSDGLTAMVDEATIGEVARSSGSMQEIATQLVRRANENGGVDNITVVAIRLTGVGSTSAPPPPEPGAQTEIGVPAVAQPKPARTKPAPPPDAPPKEASEAPSAPGDVMQVARARNRRSRRLVGAGLVSLIVLIAIAGGVIGTLQVYFIGVDQHGLVTVYRGLPYELPVSLNLYTREYVSTTPAKQLTPTERARLLDHRLRSRSDALDLIGQVEGGRLSIDGDTQ